MQNFQVVSQLKCTERDRFYGQNKVNMTNLIIKNEFIELRSEGKMLLDERALGKA